MMRDVYIRRTLLAATVLVVLFAGCRREPEAFPGEDTEFREAMDARYAQMAAEDDAIGGVLVLGDTLVVSYDRRLSQRQFRDGAVRFARDFSEQVADRREEEVEVTVRARHGGLTYAEARAAAGRIISVEP
jgi:hypothetical protein